MGARQAARPEAGKARPCMQTPQRWPHPTAAVGPEGQQRGCKRSRREHASLMLPSIVRPTAGRAGQLAASGGAVGAWGSRHDSPLSLPPPLPLLPHLLSPPAAGGSAALPPGSMSDCSPASSHPLHGAGPLQLCPLSWTASRTGPLELGHDPSGRAPCAPFSTHTPLACPACQPQPLRLPRVPSAPKAV